MSSIITAIILLTLLALIFGLILGFAAEKFKVKGNPIVEQLESVLPQTQCGQCGYPGCHPYAEAVANGEKVNKCIPGGTATMEKLAELMGVDPEPVAEEESTPIKKVAFIREDDCIGCTKCIQACPMDAIVGSGKLMHTVIAVNCTGCDLCVEPCPVDCIDMIPVATTFQNWDWKLNNIQETIPVKFVEEDKQC